MPPHYTIFCVMGIHVLYDNWSHETVKSGSYMECCKAQSRLMKKARKK